MDSVAIVSICGAILGTGGLSTLIIFLVNRKTAQANTTAQTGLTESQKKEVDERSATTVADRERTQEAFYRGLIKETEDRCTKKVEGVQSELEVFEAFVDLMIPWAWERVRDLKLADIPTENPPSLADVRMKMRAATQPSLPAARPPDG